MADWPGPTLPGVSAPTVTVEIAAIACTTREFEALVIVPVPQPPVPPVEATVTVKGVVAPGVEAVVATVSVDVSWPLVSVGLRLVVTPVGAPGFQMTVTTGVQVAVPVHVVVIEYVALLP